MNLAKPMGILIAAALWAGPSQAEVVADGTDACILAAIDEGQSAAACVDEAHRDCFAASSATPAVATLCFAEARESWGAGIAALMDRVRGSAPEEIAAIAGIEVKYDVLSGLLQCDRIEELALAASNLSGEEIGREKARCAATVAGLAYARLLWRSRDLN